MSRFGSKYHLYWWGHRCIVYLIGGPMRRCTCSKLILRPSMRPTSLSDSGFLRSESDSGPTRGDRQTWSKEIYVYKCVKVTFFGGKVFRRRVRQQGAPFESSSTG